MYMESNPSKFIEIEEYESIHYKPSNREKVKRPKKVKFWCGYCDAQLVGEYEKCPNCGHRNGIKRLKKE